MNPCFFTALSPLHMFALSACLVLAAPTATLSLAFKLLPGRLPAGTAKFEFQRTVPTIARVNRGRNAHDGAPESASGQRGESPLQAYVLRPVSDCNCVAARRGGEQQEVNGQSVG